jgi:hypothetical protein
MDRWPHDEVAEDRDQIGETAEEYGGSDQVILIHVSPPYQSAEFVDRTGNPPPRSLSPLSGQCAATRDIGEREFGRRFPEQAIPGKIATSRAKFSHRSSRTAIAERASKAPTLHRPRRSMIIDRRRLLGGLSASVLVSRVAQAAIVADGAGRAITIPEKVERIFPAGPPAAILLYTLAPELLVGWTRSPEPGQCAFLGPGACDKPEVGRLTGRGNTTNLEVLLNLKPDLVLDVGMTPMSRLRPACRSRVASRTHCSMAASTLSCRSIAS